MSDRSLLEDAAKALDYEPSTGTFRWKAKPVVSREAARWNTRYAAQEAGTVERQGYVRILFQLEGRKHKIRAHRLAWFMSTGKVPVGEIDHINQIKGDNRIENLRDVSRSQNQRNGTRKKTNSSGIPGVGWHKQRQKWCAQAACIGKRSRHIGLFDNKDDAERAVLAFRAAHGYTETHGRELPHDR